MLYSITSYYLALIIYLTLLLSDYKKINFSQILGFLNCATGLLSGGFQSGIMLGLATRVEKEQILQIFILTALVMYYLPSKQIFGNTHIGLMEAAICIITANTCYEVLKSHPMTKGEAK